MRPYTFSYRIRRTGTSGWRSAEYVNGIEKVLVDLSGYSFGYQELVEVYQFILGMYNAYRGSDNLKVLDQQTFIGDWEIRAEIILME